MSFGKVDKVSTIFSSLIDETRKSLRYYVKSNNGNSNFKRFFISGGFAEIDGLKEKISDVLLTFWSQYDTLLWNINQPFNGFIGTELLLFNTNADKIVEFLKNFKDTTILQNLCNGLLLWKKITPFLVISNCLLIP